MVRLSMGRVERVFDSRPLPFTINGDSSVNSLSQCVFRVHEVALVFGGTEARLMLDD